MTVANGERGQYAAIRSTRYAGPFSPHITNDTAIAATTSEAAPHRAAERQPSSVGDHAGCGTAAGRESRSSTIGQCSKAETMPSAIEIHHIMS